MKELVKKILVNLIYYSGLPVLAREIFQRKKVTILVMHDPDAAVAATYFEWLGQHYRVVSLDDYLEARRLDDMNRLPQKAMIITLDDGHLGNYGLLPLIRKYRIPVTVFLCSGIVDTNRHFWFRHNGISRSSDSLKVIPDQARLKILSESGFFPDKEFEYPHALSGSQIREMKEFISFQAHTVFHPCLPRCSDEAAQQEIEQCRNQLHENFGLSVHSLAYPNGDYTEREIRLARQAGYGCALTVSHGYNDGKTNLYKLRRLSVSDKDSPKLLAVKASGIWAWLKHVKTKLKI